MSEDFQNEEYMEFNTPEVATETEDQEVTDQNGKKMIRVDGFKQVLEMLQVADSDFRDSLIFRISQRDPELAANLKRALGL